MFCHINFSANLYEIYNKKSHCWNTYPRRDCRSKSIVEYFYGAASRGRTSCWESSSWKASIRIPWYQGKKFRWNLRTIPWGCCGGEPGRIFNLPCHHLWPWQQNTNLRLPDQDLPLLSRMTKRAVGHWARELNARLLYASANWIIELTSISTHRFFKQLYNMIPIRVSGLLCRFEIRISYISRNCPLS